MGRRQKIWARKAVIALREVMGGKCTRCGSMENLEFDCIEPRGPDHHKLDYARRTSFYRRERMLGNLQLLCSDCHMLKTLADRVAENPTVVIPSAEKTPY